MTVEVSCGRVGYGIVRYVKLRYGELGFVWAVMDKVGYGRVW